MMTRDDLIREISALGERAQTAGHLPAAGTLAALASCIASGSDQELFEAALEVSQTGLDALRAQRDGVN